MSKRPRHAAMPLSMLLLACLSASACLDTKADPGYCAHSPCPWDDAGHHRDAAAADGATSSDSGKVDATSPADAAHPRDAGDAAEPPADAGPCASGCTTAGALVCDPHEGCVQCNANHKNACTASTSTKACDVGTNTCVQCIDKTTCSGTAPVCETAAGAKHDSCVQCTASDDSYCKTNNKVCDTATDTCVQCLTNQHCPASAPLCANHTCGKCIDDSPCADHAGTPVCDTSSDPTFGGSCVKCTGTKYAACGKGAGAKPIVCNSLTRTCAAATVTEHSAGLCDSCLSDAQCAAQELCVKQTFGSPAIDVGYFCFWRKDATGSGAPAGNCLNVRPFAGGKLGQTSIDATTADICGLRATTCPAYKDYSSKDCSGSGSGDNSLCDDTHASSPDGYCTQDTSNNWRCTTPCLSDDDCRPGSTCPTGNTPLVCSL
ncbi:MAG TPA: hypothetical protein VF331_03250 [Polyangiales bacterium]